LGDAIIQIDGRQGAPEGQTNIGATRIDGDWNVGTTYDGTTAASPANPVYYPASAATNRTPVFFGAGTVSRKVEINNESGGDEKWIHSNTSPSQTEGDVFSEMRTKSR
jgi:hypothetical protein